MGFTTTRNETVHKNNNQEYKRFNKTTKVDLDMVA